MTIDDNMILYMPWIDKSFTEQDITNCILQLKIGNVKNIKIINGIVNNNATIYIDWNQDYHTEFIQKLINTSKKQYYIYHVNGKQYSIFNLNRVAAFQSIEKYKEKHVDIEKKKLIKNSSCCGQISQGWQASYPSIE